MPMGMYGMNLTPSIYHMNPGAPPDQAKGKGKLKEADFEAAFAQATASFSQTGTSNFVGVADVVASVEEVMKDTTLEDDTKAGDDHVDFKR